MASPVTVNDGGVNLKPELMENEQIYHCVFKDKLMLFFKDSQNFLNCYEIEEQELVKQARTASDADIEKIFEEYLRAQDLNN